MRVFAGGIETETNTFSPFPTGLDDYAILRAEADGSLHGYAAPYEAVRQEVLKRGWEFIFGFHATAQPAGITVKAVYEKLRDDLLGELEAAMPVDMVFLGLHGSMIAQDYDDCESDLLTRVRDLVGPDVKIGVELDLHCDITQIMLDKADVIVIYKEYPHIDIVDRAVEAFQLIADASEGKIQPTMAFYDCRMIGMYLTPFEPMRSFVDSMSAAEGNDGVLSISLAHCFPWADVPTSSAYMLVITDNDPQKAQQVAQEFGQRFFSLRHEMLIDSLPMDEALDKALAIESDKPVVVADQADNAGGGAPSDSTFVLEALLERGITNVGLAMIWDPIVVQIAKAGGVGANLTVRLGGKMGPMSGNPLDLDVTVKGFIADMTQDWPQKSGVLTIPCGDSVLLHCQGIDIIVNSERTQTFTQQVFEHFGVDPTKKRLLIVKSTQHFYAAFEPIAAEIIYMSAPGAIAPQFKDIPFQRVDKNKFPFVDNPFRD